MHAARPSCTAAPCPGTAELLPPLREAAPELAELRLQKWQQHDVADEHETGASYGPYAHSYHQAMDAPTAGGTCSSDEDADMME